MVVISLIKYEEVFCLIPFAVSVNYESFASTFANLNVMLIFKTIQASSVLLPPAQLKSLIHSRENKLKHISCSMCPNHLLNWLWTSAQLSRFTGYLCIYELLHCLCCLTPSVCGPLRLSCIPPPHTFSPPSMTLLYVKVCVVPSCVRY